MPAGCTIPNVFSPLTIKELLEVISRVDGGGGLIDLAMLCREGQDREIGNVRLLGVVTSDDAYMWASEPCAVPDAGPPEDAFIMGDDEGRVLVRVNRSASDTADMKQRPVAGQRVHVFGHAFRCTIRENRVTVVVADAVRILSRLPTTTEENKDVPATD